MTKFITPLLLLAVIFSSTRLFAQELTTVQAIELISQNRSELGFSDDDIQNSRVTNAYLDRVSKTKLVYLQQTYQGIPIYNVLQVLAFKDKAPVHKTGERLYNLEEAVINKRTVPGITPEDALAIASASVQSSEALRRLPPELLHSETDGLHYEFRAGSVSKDPITVEKLWVPLDDGTIKLAWQVKILPVASSDFWLIRIDAFDGKVLGKDNLTVYCSWDHPEKDDLEYIPLSEKRSSNFVVTEPANIPLDVNSSSYRVVPFPAESLIHPGGSHAIVTNPWLLSEAGNPATTLGWHNDGTFEYATTRGNNVMAYEDVAGDNTVGVIPESSTPLPQLNFDFPLDLSQEPGFSNNQKAAIVNLFYWNNLVHDLTYQYGFDEVSGNFQNSNLGRGGVGNDFVLAEAQDGSGMNNANFSVGRDGVKARMQMFIWEAESKKKITMNLPLVYQGANVSTVESDMSANNKLRNVGPITGDLVVYDQGGPGATDLACAAAINSSALNGKIALIQRGDCDFATKVKNAQDAGAIGVLVYNNQAGLSIMGGSDNSITIPALMILQADGQTLKTIMQTSTVNLTLKGGPLVDGDFDNSIIVHEYAHGISMRLTGGPSIVTCLQNQEQMGEGWSDYYALMMTTDWASATVNDGTKKRGIGIYAAGGTVEGTGIRSAPYSTDMSINSLTYNYLSGLPENAPHAVGELWAATLWDMTWNMVQQSGINSNLFNADGIGGNSDALKLVTLGMKLQPCSPGFLDGRDAILKADEILFGGKYQCAIWSAFARRGMGVDARQGSSGRINDQTAGFNLPGPGMITVKSAVESPQNAVLTYDITVKALCEPLVNYKIVDTLPSNVTYMSGGTYDAAARTVTFAIPSLSPSQSQVFNLKVKVKTGSYFNPNVIFSESVPTNSIPVTFVATSTLPTANWSTSTTAKSAPYSMKSAATGSESQQILRSASAYLITTHTQLSFWHRYTSQASRDGGLVELSIDGINWFDAAPYFALNSYNSTINAKSAIDGRSAFSGNSGEFIQSVINLSAFEGQQLYFRFRYVTDDETSSLGWYIDDIAINAYPAVYNVARLINESGDLVALSDTITKITTEILPVVWASFTVQKQNNTALLQWSTEQESNTDRFVVERSIDGVSFLPLQTVVAKGTSVIRTDYSAMDSRPIKGANYYRIKLVDKDGSVAFSETKNVTFDELPLSVVLSPNPARQHLNIQIAGNTEVLYAKVVDINGRVMQRFKVAGERHTIPLARFSEGTYFLHITGKTIKAVQTFVKE